MSHHGKPGNSWLRKADTYRAQVEAGQIRESCLRDSLVILRAKCSTLEGHVAGRDETIRAMEVERDALRERVEELEAALGVALVHPPSVAAERNVYRDALAEIEAVLHRLGTGCTFGHTEVGQ